MPETIASRENERVKWAKKLARDASFRQEQGLFFAEGRRLCLDIATQQRPRAAFFTQSLLDREPGLELLADENYLVSGPVAEKLGETKTPQGLFCIFQKPEESIDRLHPEQGVLLCEKLQDPSNAGAVLRSAAAFGFGGVAFSSGSADVYSPKALRASAGAVVRLPLLQGGELVSLAGALKEKGARFYAAAMDEDAEPISQISPRSPFVLLVGNEGSGLSQEALMYADQKVMIPMQNGVESLNAAVAASVLLYAFSSEVRGTR